MRAAGRACGQRAAAPCPLVRARRGSTLSGRAGQWSAGRGVAAVAQVSVVGLGAMGSVLARVLAEHGHDVTAWNRSGMGGPRAEGLREAGVREAATPAAAIAASPLTVMCVTDYPAAEEVLDAPGATQSLAGRTLVQLTNGTEEQVRAPAPARRGRRRPHAGRRHRRLPASHRPPVHGDPLRREWGGLPGAPRHAGGPRRRPALPGRRPGPAERRLRLGVRLLLRGAGRLS